VLYRQKNIWDKLHLRFVASIAKYNDYAKEEKYDLIPQFAAKKSEKTYFGIKTE
jgi:maltoporin